MGTGQPQPRQITLFISHSHSGDGPLCAHLDGELRRHGIDPWFSHGEQGIGPGQDWEHRLRHEIARCDVFLILASRHLHQSNWCHREAQYASHLGKHLLVVRVDDHVTPGWVDFLAGGRQHLSLARSSLQQVALDLAQLCRAAMEGDLNPGEDELQLIELPFEVAARGHVHQALVRRGHRSRLVPVEIPPCGRDQTVRKHLGGESHLTLIVRVIPTERFILLPDGTNVLVTVKVDPDALREIGRLEVPTLDGPRQIDVPAHLQRPGSRIALKGGGVGPKGRSKGDLLVEIRSPTSRGTDVPVDEFLELHRRLAVWARVFVFAAPAMVALVAATGLGGLPLVLLALCGYGLGVGGWMGALSLSRRRSAIADWAVGAAAPLCGLPAVGPALLFWCGWDLDEPRVGGHFRRALTWHSICAGAAWVLYFALQASAPDWLWRPLVVASVVAAGYFLVMLWRAMLLSEAGGRPSGRQ